MSKSLIVILFISLSRAEVQYQEIELNEKNVNAKGRSPLYAPTRCGDNELLYPGDMNDDWVCDCAPAAIYDPESDKCHMAFHKGPCKDEEIFVLGPDRFIPECIPNACKIDGQIQINNKCYVFGEAPPCPNPQLSFVLGVNPTTLMVDCVKLSINLETRFTDLSNDTRNVVYDLSTVQLCPRGCKRAYEGRCPATT